MTTAAPLEIDGYQIRPLDPMTWDGFAGLAERHNGVWGGCWCTFFHCYPDPPERKELGHREFKRQVVERGVAHAALVFDGDEAIAWAEYGTVAQLPNIHHRKQWEREAEQTPDFRITCLFVDRRYRRHGMASTAVQGALSLIAAAGGGLVEAYPHDVPRARRPRRRSFITPPGPRGLRMIVVAAEGTAAEGRSCSHRRPQL